MNCESIITAVLALLVSSHCVQKLWAWKGPRTNTEDGPQASEHQELALKSSHLGYTLMASGSPDSSTGQLMILMYLLRVGKRRTGQRDLGHRACSLKPLFCLLNSIVSEISP